MKRNLIITGAGALVVAVALIGGTMAANNAQTAEAAQAEISVNGLQGGIEVTSTDPIFDGASGINATPGGDYKIERCVRNSGGKLDYDAYFKAVIYKSWLDSNGEYINIAETDIAEDRLYTNGQKYDEVEVGDVVNGWLVSYVDDEEIELFYTQPVPVGAASSNFLEGISFAENLDNRYCGASYDLQFEITAVQANHGTDAFASALGLYPIMGADGKTIVAVSEDKPVQAE